MSLFVLALSILVPLLLAACAKTPAGVPPTERIPVTDEYHGIRVVDNYRWLEDLNDPAVRKWTDVQNAYSRGVLDKIPARQQIVERLNTLNRNTSATYSRLVWCRGLFAVKAEPSKNQSLLVWLESPENLRSERVILDLNALNPEGTSAIDWYVPSRDGRLVAVSVSENGSEEGSVNLFEVPGGRKLPDVVPRGQVATGGGDLDWSSDGTGFYYTRYPQGDERPKEDQNFYQQIYFHKLGTSPTEDAYVIGKEFPRIAECRITSSEDGRHILVSVANGDGGEFVHFLKRPSSSWEQITQLADRIVSVQFGADRLYLLSRYNASNGKILSLPLSDPRLQRATTIIPEGDVSISSFTLTPHRIYLVEVAGGPMRIRSVDLNGKNETSLTLPDLCSVGGLIATEGERILFNVQTYLEPSAWYQYDPSAGTAKKTAIFRDSPVGVGDLEVSREFATSMDGTKVPMNILRHKGTPLNGQNPTILYGYGGFGISQTPGFSVSRLLWLEQGGVYVIANLRGGGEFGEQWHEAGRFTKKQNVFNDFAACAQYLIDQKYTSPSKLAIEGGSNGGLLMGAALTQQPALFRAVVAKVGIYDMLRVETFPNGAFNVTEYGTIKDPEQFKAIYAYSPYHHVDEGKAYPAVLFLTGDHDGRVDPANSRKMTARLQAATSSAFPIMLRTTPRAGHGLSSGIQDRISLDADVYSFLFNQLEAEYKPIADK